MPRSLALLLLLPLVACEHSRDVSVQVSIPGLDSAETPAAGVQVLALPYDRDSVLAALARRAEPRPNTAALDSAFAEFRGPFVAFSLAAFEAEKLEDTVAQLAGRLAALPATSAERAALDRRRQAVTAALEAAVARRDRARQGLDAVREPFLRRTDSLRGAIRQWENSTYRGWDSIVLALAVARGEQPRADTTDARGWARFTLPPGRWWIYARSWDVGDPNAEWYWNVPVGSDTIVLSSKTGQHRPRY